MLLINEFNDVVGLNFNPVDEFGDSSAVSITGVTWLQNLGLDVIAHPRLLAHSAGALLAYVIGFLLLTYLLLVWRQKYVK